MRINGVSIGRVINRCWVWLTAIGLAIGTPSCQKETPAHEYRNVAREISLTALEKAIKESGPQTVRRIKNLHYNEGQNGTTTGKKLAGHAPKFEELLKPLIDHSKELLKTYGVTEDFLSREFKDPEDPRIILAGLWSMSMERKGTLSRGKNRAQFIDIGLFVQENTLSEAQPDWLECMLIAVGVDAIVEFVKGNVTEAIAKKAIRKIASRTLGWVGVALALYEYGNCMGWY